MEGAEKFTGGNRRVLGLEGFRPVSSPPEEFRLEAVGRGEGRPRTERGLSAVELHPDVEAEDSANTLQGSLFHHPFGTAATLFTGLKEEADSEGKVFSEIKQEPDRT